VPVWFDQIASAHERVESGAPGPRELSIFTPGPGGFSRQLIAFPVRAAESRRYL
jgi:hypothetical protein